MGAESGKTLQKWTKEQVYDRITFLYVKEWKIMRLIDADAEIEKMSEEMTRAMAEIDLKVILKAKECNKCTMEWLKKRSDIP